MKRKSLDEKKLKNSFKYAFNGIFSCIKDEQNMMIHFIVALLVIICGFAYNLTKIEWLICILLIGLVLAAELINTSIENLCDSVTTKENKYIKIAKDTSAGAVLVLAITSSIIGLMIFIPKLIEMVVI